MSYRMQSVAIFLFALAACNPIANLSDAKERIADFHALYNEGDAVRLYGKTGPTFRNETSAQEMRNLFTVISTRLGRIETSEQVNFNVATNNGVTQTVVVMQTQFERGEGIETFTFLGGGDSFELAGWNVDSPRLALTVDDLEPRNIEIRPQADMTDGPSAVLQPAD